MLGFITGILDKLGSIPLMLMIVCSVCCLSCALITWKKVFISMGMIIASALATQMIVGSITDFIGVKHALYFLVLWALSTVMLQIDILIECQRIGGDTFKVALVNGLGGSIAGAVGVLIWDILTNVIPILKPVKIALNWIPYVSETLDAVLLVILNMIFGMAIARNVALRDACAEKAPVEAKEKFNQGKKNRCLCHYDK